MDAHVPMPPQQCNIVTISSPYKIQIISNQNTNSTNHTTSPVLQGWPMVQNSKPTAAKSSN
eukprot:15343018-Ditylum_brightwellii.AAC.1